MKYTLFLLLLTLISLFAQGQHRDSIAMYGTIDTVLVQEKQLDKAKDANAGTRVSTIDYFRDMGVGQGWVLLQKLAGDIVS